MRAAALALAVLGTPAAADSFVLVHGAFAGAFAWDEVAPLLAAEGHAVLAPDLRGQGARAAEGGPDVTVEDHVREILAAIEAAEPPVILVAHSYGTRPAAGAWDRIEAEAPGTIAHVVWVEGTAPVVDPPPGAPLLRADAPTLTFLVATAPDVASSGMLPPTGTDPRLAPMSLRALTGEVPATGNPLPATPCTYVLATGSALPLLRRYAEALRDRRGCALVELEGGHDIPTDAPEALAATLLAIADATP